MPCYVENTVSRFYKFPRRYSFTIRWYFEHFETNKQKKVYQDVFYELERRDTRHDPLAWHIRQHQFPVKQCGDDLVIVEIGQDAARAETLLLTPGIFY